MVCSLRRRALNTTRTEGFSPIVSASLCVREAEKPSLSLNPDPIIPSQTHQQSLIKVEEKGQIPTNPVEPNTHHLDPDETASNPDEMAAVYSTLMTVENLVEVKPTVAKMVCERTKLLKWLLGSGLLGSRFCDDEVVLVGFWVSM